MAASGRLTDLKTGLAATVDDVAKAADNKRFVFLGEDHATEPDQLKPKPTDDEFGGI